MSEQHPIFIHIGYYKAASTFLQDTFGNSPNIGLLLHNFFFMDDSLFERGPSFYGDLLPKEGLDREFIVVDSNENYSLGRFIRESIQRSVQREYNLKAAQHHIRHDISEMAWRIYSTVPDAKVIAVVRSQLSWLLSVYKHNVVNMGIDTNFAAFLRSNLGGDILKAGNYYQTVSMYQEYYGKGNIKVLLFEDFVHQQDAFFAELSDFLGVPLDSSLYMNARKNTGVDALTVLLLSLINRVGEASPTRKERRTYLLLRKYLFWLRRYYKHFGFVKRVSLIGSEDRAFVKNHYSRSNHLLSSVIGKSREMRQYDYF